MKKILSVLLAVCMLLSVAPMAFAEEEGVANEQVVEEVVDEISEEELVKEEFIVVENEEETEAPADDETAEGEEEPEMPVFSLAEAFAYVTALDFEGLVAYIGQFLNIETLKYAIDNALEKIGGLGIGDFLDGSLVEGVFGSFTDVCATIADVLVDLLAMVGIDFDQIVSFIEGSDFLSFISTIYAYGGQGEVTTEEPSSEVVDPEPVDDPEPTPADIPETGVADMGLAAFAALTVAGAAAFVLRKKKA